MNVITVVEEDEVEVLGQRLDAARLQLEKVAHSDNDWARRYWREVLVRLERRWKALVLAKTGAKIP